MGPTRDLFIYWPVQGHLVNTPISGGQDADWSDFHLTYTKQKSVSQDINLWVDVTWGSCLMRQHRLKCQWQKRPPQVP
ncbi:hypothetical protein WJX77_009994 [Trebouxia sp. C0004]